MVARGVEVQTARVREPAARPECNPEMASSTTRPKTNISNKICCREGKDIHFLGSTPHRKAPATYGAGWGFPCETSFEVIMPKAGAGTPERRNACGAYLLEAKNG